MKPEVVVKLKVKGVEIELSPDDLRDLVRTLQGLTGVKEYVPYYPWPISIPTVWEPVYQQPATYTITYTGGTQI